MAMTLVDQAKLAKADDLKRAIIESILECAPLMNRVPFATVGTLSQRGDRWNSLPSVAFRNLSEAFTESTGTLEQYQEGLYPLGGLTDVEHLLADDKNVITDPRALQQKMKAESMARVFADAFINGDRSTTPKGFDGLKVRISNLPATQIVDGATLDISTAANRTGQNGYAFLEKLRTAIYMVERVCGKPDVMIMNDNAYLALNHILIGQGLLKVTQDAYDREITTFMGIEILDAGFKQDLATKIITDTHDGDSTNTSIYFAKFGDEYFTGLQMKSLDALDLGRTPDGVYYRTHVEWTVGLMTCNKFSLSRLKGIKVV